MYHYHYHCKRVCLWDHIPTRVVHVQNKQIMGRSKYEQSLFARCAVHIFENQETFLCAYIYAAGLLQIGKLLWRNGFFHKTDALFQSSFVLMFFSSLQKPCLCIPELQLWHSHREVANMVSKTHQHYQR